MTEELIALGIPETVVRVPDMASREENVARERILSYRGWPNTALFTRFPSDIGWSRVLLDRDELAAAR